VKSFACTLICSVFISEWRYLEISRSTKIEDDVPYDITYDINLINPSLNVLSRRTKLTFLIRYSISRGVIVTVIL